MSSSAAKTSANCDKPLPKPSVEEPQCDPALLSSDISASLPEGYRMRPLQLGDYNKSYMECLAQLTTVGSVSFDKFQERFHWLQRRADEYHVIVIEEMASGRIVASGTILAECKFIRECGMVGHIEDIVVHDGQRGKNFGKKIIDQLTHIGKQRGCYKIILCCDEKNTGFYEKCGYVKKEVEMVHYF